MFEVNKIYTNFINIYKYKKHYFRKILYSNKMTSYTNKKI